MDSSLSADTGAPEPHKTYDLSETCTICSGRAAG